jgi:hypothetical protein
MRYNKTTASFEIEMIPHTHKMPSGINRSSALSPRQLCFLNTWQTHIIQSAVREFAESEEYLALPDEPSKAKALVDICQKICDAFGKLAKLAMRGEFLSDLGFHSR